MPPPLPTKVVALTENCNCDLFTEFYGYGAQGRLRRGGAPPRRSAAAGRVRCAGVARATPEGVRGSCERRAARLRGAGARRAKGAVGR